MSRDPESLRDDLLTADEASGADGEDVEILEFEGSSDRDEPPATPPAAPKDAAAARELAEIQERHLRLRADFDNFRKRVEREREETRRYALAEPLRDLLPVLDNLERAAGAQGRLEDLQRGVEMIARQFAEILKRFGLAEVPALGQPFDPKVHEAVASEESAEVEAPTVVGEMQRGYRLHERLLRPAMVRVALPAEPAAGAEAEGAAAEGGTAGDGEPSGEAS